MSSDSIKRNILHNNLVKVPSTTTTQKVELNETIYKFFA